MLKVLEAPKNINEEVIIKDRHFIDIYKQMNETKPFLGLMVGKIRAGKSCNYYHY